MGVVQRSLPLRRTRVRRLVMLQKLRRTAQEAISPALLERCRDLQQRIGIRSLVRYAYSEIVDAPAVVGWVRPLVLIPLSSIAGLSIEQLEAVIAHELAHVRRYDALVNLFQIAIETVLFYHPAVWWVNRVIRTERENCCDDIAVALCGDAREYARALATLGTARPAWAMAANGGALKTRVGRLLGMQKMTHGIPRAGLAVLAVLCASCVLLAAGAFTQDVPPVPPAPQPPQAAVPETPLPPLAPAALPEQITSPLPPVKPGPPPLPAAPAEAPHARRMQSGHTDDSSGLRAIAARTAELRRDAVQVAAEQKPEQPGGASYIDSLESAGLTKLSVDDLISLKIQGVTADYVRQIKAAGLDPTAREIVTLKIQGVSPEYIRAIHETGVKPGLHELISMKVQDVTPELIRALQSAGLGDLKPRDFIAAKVQGITPSLIEKVRSHGFKDLTFRQLIRLKIAGVF